jgi:DNA gyrase inhibitor GyrI
VEPEGTGAQVVEREPIPVMFLRTVDDVAEMRQAWARLEELVGLRVRRFYGAFHPSTGEYHACAELREGDDPAALGLEAGVPAGGRYLRARLRGEPPGVYDRIGPTFVALARHASAAGSRPSIEFYRRRDEIDPLLHVS